MGWLEQNYRTITFWVPVTSMLITIRDKTLASKTKKESLLSKTLATMPKK